MPWERAIVGNRAYCQGIRLWLRGHGPGSLLRNPEFTVLNRIFCQSAPLLAPTRDHPAYRTPVIASQPFFAQHNVSAAYCLYHNTVSAAQSHPQRRCIARFIEPARTDPVYIAETILGSTLRHSSTVLLEYKNQLSARNLATKCCPSTNTIRCSTQTASPI